MYFLHIGFPKTGTTSLQTAFASIQSIHSLGFRENFTYASEDFQEFYRYLTFTSSQEYLETFADSLFKKCFNAIDSKKNILISEENISGVSFGDAGLISDRIKHFFPEAKILIIVRNQLDFIRSYYEMSPFDPFAPSANTKRMNFDQWLDLAIKYEYLSFLPNLRYNYLIERYQSLYGKENVLVLPYELWIKTPSQYYASIETHFKLSKGSLADSVTKLQNQNTASHFYVYTLYRQFFGTSKINQWVPIGIKKQLLSVAKRWKPKPEMSPEKLQFFRSYYADSNHKLEENLKLGISDFEYPL